MYLKFHVKNRLWVVATCPRGASGAELSQTEEQAHAPAKAPVLTCEVFPQPKKPKRRCRTCLSKTPKHPARVQGCLSRQGWCQQEGCNTSTTGATGGVEPHRGRNKGCYQSMAGGSHFCLSTCDTCQDPGATRWMFACHDPGLIRLADKTGTGI